MLRVARVGDSIIACMGMTRSSITAATRHCRGCTAPLWTSSSTNAAGTVAPTIALSKPASSPASTSSPSTSTDSASTPTQSSPTLPVVKITIDGPAASGKSSTAKAVAARLHFTHIDSGAMYRALTLKIMRQQLALPTPERCAELAPVFHALMRRAATLYNGGKGLGEDFVRARRALAETEEERALDALCEATQMDVRSEEATMTMTATTARSVSTTPMTSSEAASETTSLDTLPTLASRIILDGEDVTEAIRGQDVTREVSRIASIPIVRLALVGKQRELAARADRGVVMDGRDCGTAVFPDAHLKIFLKADALTRARRRLAELQQQHAQTGAVHGLPLPTLDRLCGEIQRRDDADIGRAISPLRKADDAVEIDGTELSREQQVEAIVRLAEEVVRRFK